MCSLLLVQATFLEWIVLQKPSNTALTLSGHTCGLPAFFGIIHHSPRENDLPILSAPNLLASHDFSLPCSPKAHDTAGQSSAWLWTVMTRPLCQLFMVQLHSELSGENSCATSFIVDLHVVQPGASSSILQTRNG